MRSSRRAVVTLVVLLVAPGALGAQGSGRVRGRVTDAASGQPVPDVRVSIEGTSVGTATLASGEYSLPAVPAGARTVVARRVGYALVRASVNVTPGDTVEVNFTLRAAAVALDVVVVTGLAAPAERRMVGNTVEQIGGDAVNAAPAAGAVDQALQGKVAGALISQNTGQPGGGVSVRLRGTSTILGNAEPLWVVDGVIVDNSSEALVSLGANAGRGNAALSNRLSDIAPGDIDRVEVLKGGAAAALYGSRANSGVIQIFTKRGRQGAARVAVHTDLGFSETPQRFEFNLAPQAGYADVLNGGATAIGAPVQRYDIQDSVWRTGASTTTRVSVSGGSGGSSYYASGGYGYLQGIDRSTDRRHTSVLGRLSQQVSPKLDVDVTGNVIQSHSNLIPEGEQTQGVITSLVFTPTSVKPFYDPAIGRYPYNPNLGANPLDVLHNWKAQEDVTRFLGSVQAAYRPTPSLTVRYLLGLDDYRQEDGYLQPPASTGPTFTGLVQNPIRTSRRLNSEGTLSHSATPSPSLGLTSTLGFRYTRDRTEVLNASAADLPPEQTLVGGATQFASQSLTELRTEGSFLEERLAIRDRLFLTGGLNLEGASAFGPDERWQLYPRVSGSWLVNQEPFGREGWLGTHVSSLRLRAAYGETGGQPPSAYSQFENYVNVAYGGKPGLVASNTTGNPSLKPERQHEIEGGLDAGLWRDRALLEFTYYHQRTTDLVLPVPLAPSTGAARQLQNVGVLTNKGWEAALTTVNIDAPRLSWRTRLSLAANRNRVTKLVTGADTLVFDYLNAVIQGQPIGVFFGGYYLRNTDGSIAYGPFVVNQFGKIDTLLLPLIAKDTIGPGNIVNRRKIIGDPNPALVASLSNTLRLGRRLEVSFLLDGRFGNDVANFTRRITELFGVDKVVEREISGDTIPRTFSRNPASRSLIYEEYIEDGSFVKLREVAVSLHFDQPWVRRFGAEAMDVRLAARNLHTWSSYRGLDPEVNLFSASTVSRGVDFANTPIPRSFTVSVDLSF